MTNYINCNSTQEMFSALADGELGVTELDLIKSHLATCSQCAEEWRLFKASLDWLHEVETVPAPADLLVGIYAKLDRGNPLTNWLQDLFGSPLRALSSMAVIGIALFFWVANDVTNHNHTGGIIASSDSVNQIGAPSRQIKTIPVVSQSTSNWRNNSAASPYRLSTTQIFSPDVSITVHAANDDAKERLYQRLVSHDQWRIQPIPGGLLICLNEQDIPHLQHTLAPHQLQLTPTQSRNGRTGKLRTVSLRITTQ